jgi:hypothetical protein
MLFDTDDDYKIKIHDMTSIQYYRNWEKALLGNKLYSWKKIEKSLNYCIYFSS